MPSKDSVRNERRGPLRLGRLGFVNVLPVYMHMTQDSCLFQEILGSPSQLNKMLALGLLDVSVVSSIEYAFRPEHYLILPDLSISCLGRVRSVLLFSELPMHQLGEGPIQCPMESQTSVALLELLLDGLWGTKGTLVPERGWQRPVAFLRIGDRALREMASGKWRYWWDLGQAWFEWTGLPFVFALWLVRREVVERDPQRIAQLHRSLIASRERDWPTCTAVRERPRPSWEKTSGLTWKSISRAFASTWAQLRRKVWSVSISSWPRRAESGHAPLCVSGRLPLRNDGSTWPGSRPKVVATSAPQASDGDIPCLRALKPFSQQPPCKPFVSKSLELQELPVRNHHNMIVAVLGRVHVRYLLLSSEHEVGEDHAVYGPVAHYHNVVLRAAEIEHLKEAPLDTRFHAGVTFPPPGYAYRYLSFLRAWAISGKRSPISL